MKDDNLPPNNETVEDGGGCYVAGSREQDAAHSLYRIEYDNDTGPRDDYYREWWTVVEIKSDEEICKCDKEQAAIDIVASLTELTRLHSELQQAKQEIANHIAVNSLLTDSDGEADLANKLYQATSELQRERELRNELLTPKK